jgi:two-component system sensor histidine kinase YesM
MRLLYKKKLIVILLVIILVPSSIAFFYGMSSIVNDKKNDVIKNNLTIINNEKNYIDNIFLMCDDIVNKIQLDLKVSDYLQKESVPAAIQSLEFYEYFRSMFAGIGNSSGYVVSINRESIQASNKINISMYSSNKYIIKSEFMDSTSALDKATLEYLNANFTKFGIEKKYDTLKRAEIDKIVFYRLMEYTNQNNNCIVKITMDPMLFKRLSNKDIPNNSKVYFNFENLALFNLNIDAGEVANNENLKTYFFIQSTFSSSLISNNSHIYMYIPNSYFIEETKDTVIIFFLIAAIYFLMSVSITIYLSKVLTKRLYSLVSIANNDVDRLINSSYLGLKKNEPKDEFDVISNRLNELLDRVHQYNLVKKKMETELLQSLFNPHFLYNTLASIKYANKGNKELVDLLDSLVSFYRISLNKGISIIKVSDELKMIKEYLKIQMFSYKKTFEYVIEIDDEINEEAIIKNILQPFVENAFIHGVNTLNEGGIIKIKGQFNEAKDKMIFEISDNGPGMTKQKIDEVLNLESHSQYGGYGISNSINILKVYYGDEKAIEIKSEISKGTQIIIVLPLLNHELELAEQ